MLSIKRHASWYQPITTAPYYQSISKVKNTAAVNKARLRNIHYFCNKHGNEKRWEINLKATDKRLNRLWVDEKHKIVYCNIPKVASTNWYRVFLKFAGMNATMVNEASLYDIHSNLKKNYLRRLADFGSEQREIIMRNYFKFMFVRNPLDRLLSAFKDRLLLKHGNAYFTEGLQIFKTFRSKKEIKSYGKEGTKPIQFEEFLQ